MNAESVLRNVLWVDAVFCFVIGIGCVSSPHAVASMTGIPVLLLKFGGVVLIAAASWAAWLASRLIPPGWGVRALVLAAMSWVIASIALALSPQISLTVLGKLALWVQLVTIFVLSVAEWLAVDRRMSVGRI